MYKCEDKNDYFRAITCCQKKSIFFYVKKIILDKVMGVQKFRKGHFTQTREKGDKNGLKRHILTLNCRHLIKN